MSRLVTTRGMLVGAPGSGMIARGDLNEARYAAPTAAGSALALAQSLADGLSGALLQVIDRFDANYQARRDYVDKLGPVFSNNPIVLLADATETLTTTVASGIANTPSAIAHPIRTFVREPAAFIDGALREEAKGQGYQRAYAALRSSTPRQVAAGIGRTAGAAVLIAGPSKLAAGRTSFVPREYAPIAAERIPGRVTTLIERVDTPNPLTGAGYGVNNPPVRIAGEWSNSDTFNGLYGRSPQGLGRPQLHHADQMPGSGIHEILASDHLGNPALRPNKWNQGVTAAMRTQDTRLHWWYRAQEQGAWSVYPNHIYD